jgi:diamine N-acetyltransferase
MTFISPATLQDIPIIQEVNLQVWPQTYSGILTPQQVDYMLHMMYSSAALQQQMNSGHYFIMAKDEMDNVNGFASYSLIEKEVFKLHKLYVIPKLQGKGVAKELLDYIINDIRFMGARALDLNVNRYNLRAKAFYDKQCFKVLYEEDIDIGQGFYMNDYYMRLYLDDLH